MFGAKGRLIAALTLQRSRAEGVAAERYDTIRDLEKRLDEAHRRISALRDELRYTNRLMAERRPIVTEHEFGVFPRVDGPPLPRLSAGPACGRCSGTRKVDAGEDGIGEVIIPCPDCCCYVCSDFTGGGVCDVCKEVP